MKTKFLILSIALFFISTTLVAQISVIGGKKIYGNGKESTITKMIDSFNKIKIIGNLEVIIDTSSQSKLQINGEENLIGYIKIKNLKNGTLKIVNPIKHQLITTNNKKIKVILPHQEISDISLSGSGKISSKRTINVEDLNILIRGSGQFDLSVNVNRLNCKISGSGKAIITGRSDFSELVTRGNSIIDVSKLQAKNKKIVVSGSGKIKDTE